MFELLLKMVDLEHHKLSKQAGEVLLAVARCASGEDGCTLAEDDEVDILLQSLTKINASVRTIALQVNRLSEIKNLYYKLPPIVSDYMFLLKLKT